MIHHTIEHKNRHSLIFDPRLYDSLNFGTLCGDVEFPIASNVPNLKELFVKTRYTTLIRKSDLLSFWGGHLLYVVYEGYLPNS